MGLVFDIILAYSAIIYGPSVLMYSGLAVILGLVIACLLIYALIFVLMHVFAIPWLIHKGTIEPVWRSVPRIWNRTRSWSTFFSETWQQDKRQMRILFSLA